MSEPTVDLQQENDALRAELAACRAHAKRLREALEVEWIRGAGGITACRCGASQSRPSMEPLKHKPGCALASTPGADPREQYERR